MNQKQRFDRYEAELRRLHQAQDDGQISEEEMNDAIDGMVFPLFDKPLSECSVEERFRAAVWFRQKGDEAMQRAEVLLPGITANPGVGVLQ